MDTAPQRANERVREQMQTSRITDVAGALSPVAPAPGLTPVKAW